MSVVSCESSAGNNVFPPPEVLLGAWAGSAALAYCRDRQGGFIAANAAFARKFGCNPAELTGRSGGAAMPSALLSTLADIVGSAHCLTGSERGAYVVDGRTPRAVVFPGSVEDVSRLVAATTAAGAY